MSHGWTYKFGYKVLTKSGKLLYSANAKFNENSFLQSKTVEKLPEPPIILESERTSSPQQKAVEVVAEPSNAATDKSVQVTHNDDNKNNYDDDGERLSKQKINE